ncbi:hypothetical protein LCGC14_1870990, partial [marine sediment metagenome]
IGRFWVEAGCPQWPSSVPVQPRLFQTRAEARDFLRKMKGHRWVAYPNAQVVRVLVSVEVMEEETCVKCGSCCWWCLPP